MTKCWECSHFKIQYEPLHGIGGLYDFGRAKCEKHDLIVDFPDHRKLKKLECVEKPPEEVTGMPMEKVIKGLECCSQMAGEACNECPYANECEE